MARPVIAMTRISTAAIPEPVELPAATANAMITPPRPVPSADPSTEASCIDAVADMRGLRDQMSADEKAQIDSDSGNYVLNGIAHDGATGTFYVTGKRWKSIFTGRFVEGPR